METVDMPNGARWLHGVGLWHLMVDGGRAWMDIPKMATEGGVLAAASIWLRLCKG